MKPNRVHILAYAILALMILALFAVWTLMYYSR